MLQNVRLSARRASHCTAHRHQPTRALLTRVRNISITQVFPSLFPTYQSPGPVSRTQRYMPYSSVSLSPRRHPSEAQGMPVARLQMGTHQEHGARYQPVCGRYPQEPGSCLLLVHGEASGEIQSISVSRSRGTHQDPGCARSRSVSRKPTVRRAVSAATLRVGSTRPLDAPVPVYSGHSPEGHNAPGHPCGPMAQQQHRPVPQSSLSLAGTG